MEELKKKRSEVVKRSIFLLENEVLKRLRREYNLTPSGQEPITKVKPIEPPLVF
ncbi:MAG: hypothetical protein ACP5KW_11645 [Thermoproteota archaeon]